MRQIGGEADSALPRDLGEADVAASAEHFAGWKQKLSSDPDVSADLRRMVPLFYDQGREMTKVWVFLGWTERPLSVGWVTTPKVHVVGEPPADWDQWQRENPERSVGFMGDEFSLYYPVTAEVYVSELMDREQFRAHCDRYRTRSAILSNLPGRGNWLSRAAGTVGGIPWLGWLGIGLVSAAAVGIVLRLRARRATA
jgi:hypothetical protein